MTIKQDVLVQLEALDEVEWLAFAHTMIVALSSFYPQLIISEDTSRESFMALQAILLRLSDNSISALGPEGAERFKTKIAKATQSYWAQIGTNGEEQAKAFEETLKNFGLMPEEPVDAEFEVVEELKDIGQVIAESEAALSLPDHLNPTLDNN